PGTRADERIDYLVDIAIEQQESLDNLPVIIIQGLADDNLDDNKINQIRLAWASMPEKNLLEFLRAYAVSTIFHDPNRVKYFHAMDRWMLFQTRMITSNEEAYLDLYSMWNPNSEDYDIFNPNHVVFGGQTGLEAADSSLVFRSNHLNSTDNNWRFSRYETGNYGRTITKDWTDLIPPNGLGQYVTKDIAEWLWKHYTADGLKNFGLLERAHIYSLMANKQDIANAFYPGAPDTIITTNDLITDSELIDYINMIAAQPIALDSLDNNTKSDATRRVALAVNFIMGTPYVFAQEGK
ncbi:MAG: hypothetical protein HKM24_01835, partial [Gammaproteobacteria bacterium]|nr:hypothetical protein [Gammaproteobacteria bacterium]